MAPRRVQGGVQPFAEHGAVGQAGQRVMMGQEAQFVLGLAQGGHIPRHTDAGLDLIGPEG
ncbi:hypothetical protein D3C77_720300 [compost metagenome]